MTPCMLPGGRTHAVKKETSMRYARASGLFAISLGIVSGCNCDGSSTLRNLITDLRVEPTSVDFGTVAIGDSKDAIVTISNRGTRTIKLSGFVVGSEGDFAVARAPEGMLLSPQQNATVTVTFKPLAPEELMGALRFAGDDQPELRRIPLRGRGTIGIVAIEPEGSARCGRVPESLAFGYSRIGVRTERSITVRSVGSATVTITSAAFEMPSTVFDLVEPEVKTIPPGRSIALKVGYKPVASGHDQTILKLGTSSINRASISIPICGDGASPSLCARPVPLDIGPVTLGTTGTAAVRLSNCGQGTLTLGSLQIADDAGHRPSTGFVLANGALPVTLTGEQTFTATVTYTPPDLGPATAFLRAESDALDRTVSYFPIQSIGVERCRLTVVPTSLSFPGVAPGRTRDQRALVVNNDTIPCTLSRVRIGDGDAVFSVVSPPTLPETLPVGGYKEITVRYAPASSGTIDRGRLDVIGGSGQSSVNLIGNAVLGPQCSLLLEPSYVAFGIVPPRMRVMRGFRATNIGTAQTCMITGLRTEAMSDPGFGPINAAMMTIPPGQSTDISVGFQPAHPGRATGILMVESNDPVTPRAPVSLFGASPDSGICVEPRSLDFGRIMVSAEQEFRIRACRGNTVTITGLPFRLTDPQFAVVSPPPLPIVLAPGAVQRITVRYVPTTMMSASAVISVLSDDVVTPMVDVDVTGGPVIAPPSAGRYLYFWSVRGGGGNINKMPLQGIPTVTPYWGMVTGRGCMGCHNISPDGRYLAVVSQSPFSLKMVDTRTNTEVPLSFTSSDTIVVSWRPNVNTNPPYQFAFDNNRIVQIASAETGALIGPLSGADTPGVTSQMPSWGPNGKIAFVRAARAAGSPGGVQGPSDVMLIDETGGTAQPLAGASNNMLMNYYPSYSPNGLWIAYNTSARGGGGGGSSYAARDALLRLVDANNSGQVLMLPNLNGGASSFPTWSNDGTILSFSSDRPGGMGGWDIWYGLIDPITGVDSPAMNMTAANSPEFEHLAHWSP